MWKRPKRWSELVETADGDKAAQVLIAVREGGKSEKKCGKVMMKLLARREKSKLTITQCQTTKSIE